LEAEQVARAMGYEIVETIKQLPPSDKVT
jgi:hypothetical protein